MQSSDGYKAGGVSFLLHAGPVILIASALLDLRTFPSFSASLKGP